MDWDTQAYHRNGIVRTVVHDMEQGTRLTELMDRRPIHSGIILCLWWYHITHLSESE